MQTAPCPVCHSDIIIEEGIYENDLVCCANCGAELEIASLHPVRLINMEEETEESSEDLMDENGYPEEKE